MIDDLSKIIDSVGTNYKKMLTLVVLLLFIGGMYIFNSLEYENQCSDLIQQNQNLMKNNVNITNSNSKIMDNNILLANKICELEKKLNDRDTVYIPYLVEKKCNENKQITKPIQIAIKDSISIYDSSIVLEATDLKQSNFKEYLYANLQLEKNEQYDMIDSSSTSAGIEKTSRLKRIFKRLFKSNKDSIN